MKVNMAMQATHVRFAIEFEKELGVLDRAEYLSGVMYSDSRYTSGIDRHLTHDSSLKITYALVGSDFEKGWKIHVLYDMLEHDYIFGLFNITAKLVAFSDYWIKISAAKFIEDLESFKLLKESKIIESISPTSTPNNEDPSKLSKWYDLQRSVYCSEIPSIESYKPMMDWFDEDVPGAGVRWEATTRDLEKDPEMVKNIHAMYGMIVKEFYDGLRAR
ncbi:MAG: hypothetical protein UU40_C0005G0013 [Candidatus Uhrbacteria bacterium GW2011_GWD2_41_121]|uniref:Uncharacterized protein n=1 Tax=Candidatus Uhrbacteria bacterium GW2011_GWC1_41_20 TaxID=1618983 RepID=A0A0G0VIS1_9BACT|nr:MAG: hypothetical protein UT52_C0007G0013 [Candidatus Uhrbacteria bacterium GW2011_GWE1_39_46]KKR64149.1 MAG: hypothetical protein UU04_C0005G0013 [Candidatus Uhrbacteria bacterium GW2011_GWC2_40_450]KKR90284.1 MAG: hypothetical protein UU40_C0005G0013 [Candidatus Uhrbacteria bacterium GW2011_GWD2_41_121]KKR95211.1 MAG: hypothetical protein UU46_C0026G0013 [Candidatus Uhrbacteria bacterium GW2011_GWD1_41_16]KKR99506.1 MAG: hypothetical protein UU50_C0005G0013 [Candidatus Uhrbacteria bacteriu